MRQWQVKDVMTLQTLRDHGVRIAIDDFGTGCSSLAYLRELPVDGCDLAQGYHCARPGPIENPYGVLDARATGRGTPVVAG